MQLWSYITSHNTFSEGYGRKTHIRQENKATSLCGYDNLFDSYPVSEEWINQPNPDKELCEKCKKIALKLLQQSK